MTSIPIRTGAGGIVNVSVIALPDGTTGLAHVLVDGAGVPYSAAHPLLTAPAIEPVSFADHSGTIATAGATALDIPADAARKGGSIRAAETNAGTITVTLRDAAGNTHAERLGPGASFSITINGYVLQVEVLVSGDTVGDAFSGVTFS